jgi:translation initiation factor IF-2
MNITELARKLRVNAEELREKLPALGFDIGRKAIKIDDSMAFKIVRAWNDFQIRKRQEEDYLKHRQRNEEGELIRDKSANLPAIMTVKDFAQLLNLPVTDVIKELMRNGVMASLNQRIDYDTAAIVASDLGYNTTLVKSEQVVEVEQDEKVKDILSKQTEMVERPPVIVVMGHVDHGKTKLLDAIRKTDVVAGEAGGITQHIGAYQIVRHGRTITFIDTPGHEAFTAMRSRGAKVADIAILVVAANDSVMPQTIEAQKIAEAAGIPIVVAINKIDLPDANIEKTKQDLSQHNLLCEEWGGKTVCVPISAKQNLNIDDLLDQVLLVSDMEKEKVVANPNGTFIGTIVESHVDTGMGPVSTVLVKNGTLRVGDKVVDSGVYYGRIRNMYDYKGKEIVEAGPSTPAMIIGLKVSPKVGDLIETTTEKVKIVKNYKNDQNEETFITQPKDDSETDDSNVTKLNVILRSDVLGSQEAIVESLEKINNAKIKIKFVSKGLGNITENDVLSASATGAMLIGFSVVPSNQAMSLAREKKVTIKTFKVIYELIDSVKAQINEIVKPEIVREELGKVRILKIFKTENNSMILGGRVLSGQIEKNSEAAVLRDDQFVIKGKITEMRAGKELVTMAVKGEEFGLTFVGNPIVQENDVLDVYKEREIKVVV